MKGGRREGAGRPKGSLNKDTLEKKKVEEAFTRRVLNAADRLFNSQLALAEGTTYLYKIVETGSGKDKKREHVLVTDPDEIKQVLDEAEGTGIVDDTYYYMTTKAPDNKAIDSLLDRAFGKAVMKLGGTGDDGEIKVSVTNYGNQPASQLPTPPVSASTPSGS